MKKSAKILKFLLVLLIAASLVGGVLRFWQKSDWDGADRVVSMIMDYSEADMIAIASDGQYELSAFTTTGFSALMLPAGDSGYDKLTLEDLRAGGLAIGLLPGDNFNCEQYVADYLKLGANFPLLVADSLSAGTDLSYADTSGFSLALYEGEAPAFDMHNSVLVYRVSGMLEGDGSDGTAAALQESIVSAVVDDGARVIYFPALRDLAGGVNGDLSAYFSLINSVSKELSRYGYVLGADFNIAPAPSVNFSSLLICLGACALLVLFITGVKRLRSRTALIILLSLLALTLLLWFVARSFISSAMRGVLMLTIPGLAIYYLAGRCRALHLSNGNRSVSSVFFYALGVMLVAGLISIIGAHLAKFIDLSPSFITPAWLSTGVHIVTIIYAAVVIFRLLYRQEDTNFGEYIASVYIAAVKNKARTVAIALIFFTAAVLWFFVIRTSPYSLGDSLNSFMGRLITVYPSASQYLIGYPSMVAALILCSRRMRSGAWPLLLLSCIPCVSVLLASAASTVPLRHTLLSSVVGLGLGIFTGAVIGLIVSLIIRALKLRTTHTWKLY